MEQKGRDVPDVRTPACMKAPEVPPLLVRTSDQSPEKIAGRLSKFSGAWSEIGADAWVMRIVQWGYKIPFVTLPPLRFQGQETTYPKGSLKWSSLNQSVQELRNKGAIEPAPLSPGFYSRLFLVRKATGEWRPIIDLSSLNVFVHCPSFTMETPRSILRALQQGQWLTSLDLKDAYFHIGIHPADRRYLRFCHNGTSWQFTVLPFGLSTSPRVFTKILKPVLAYAHLHRVKLHMYLDDWLLNPGTLQEAHEQTSWLRSLCQKLGLVINLEKSDLIPSQVSTYLGIELDTSVGLARPSLKRLTNWLSVAEGFTAQQSPPPMAPSTWTPSLSRETSALWSNSHSSHSMAIETPVEPVEGEILKTDPTRPSVPPGHPMVDQQGQFTKGSPSRDHRCGVLPVYRQQYSGLGCPLAGSNCIWHLVPGPVPITHQCPGASSHMAWPKSFQPESGEYEGCAHVRQHVSGCLPEKSGGHQIARNERFSHGHMSVVREEGNDSSSPLSSRASECVSGPSVPEGSNPQDRVEPEPDHSRQDFSCLGQTIRGSVRPREEHETGNIRLPHSGGDVLESGQSCPELGRPVRICVPSDKPDKGLSKQGQNRKR